MTATFPSSIPIRDLRASFECETVPRKPCHAVACLHIGPAPASAKGRTATHKAARSRAPGPRGMHGTVDLRRLGSVVPRSHGGGYRPAGRVAIGASLD